MKRHLVSAMLYFVLLSAPIAFAQTPDMTSLDERLKAAQTASEAEDYAKALALLQAARSMQAFRQLPLNTQADLSYSEACLHAMLGQNADAMQDLRTATALGFSDIGRISNEDVLKSLRTDPDSAKWFTDFSRKFAPKPLQWEYRSESPFALVLDSADNPQLNTLRSEFEIDKVVAGTQTEHDRLRKLTEWTTTRWEHNSSQMASRNDPLTILREAKQGGRFICMNYAVVLGATAAAYGLPSRMLGLLPKQTETRQDAHSVTEVWLPSFHKWVLADGNYGQIAELQGTPLNAIELQDAIARNKPVQCTNPATCREWLGFIGQYLYYFKITRDQRWFESSDFAQLVLMPQGATPPTSMNGNRGVFAASRYTSNPGTFYAEPQIATDAGRLGRSAVVGVKLKPDHTRLRIGESQQFSAVVSGKGVYGSPVIWSVNDIVGGDATVGTVSAEGLYITPYPAPAMITIKATSLYDATKSASAKLTISAPPRACGPALTVDVAAPAHPISPLIYGTNAYGMGVGVPEAARFSVDRWGGSGVSRYNYKLDISNHESDWFFENIPDSNNKYPEVSKFNTQVAEDRAAGAKTWCTLPVIGWVAKSREHISSFSVAKYGPQQKTDPYWPDCGNGVRPDGTLITNNDPLDANMPVDETWAGHWVKFLVSKFGRAADGGVAFYGLDNEPEFWNTVHRDVHPAAATCDEITSNGLKVAKAVKAADPTAEVGGPEIAYWPAYFYSMKDIQAAWAASGSGVFEPADRKAHGNLEMIEHYLRVFKAAQDADPDHTRFLDYLSLHAYLVVPDAPLKPAGTTDKQMAVLDSTRALWDPAYTHPQFSDPGDAPRFAKSVAPRIIPRMKDWIVGNYPGTKTAITEYNWGGLEHISGAVAQADVLGIFGREGLDMGLLWGPPDPKTQQPGLNAFKMFRNYDNSGGEFGDLSVSANSTDQGKLAVYAARRTSDHSLTVMVINKTFGDLKTNVALPNIIAAGPVKAFQYSNADLNVIRELPSRTVSLAPRHKVASEIENQVFPAMSITLYIVSNAS